MLTPEEQKELAELEQWEANAASSASGLTPEEQKELAELEQWEKQTKQPGKKLDKLKAAAAGIAQGASMGFLDEVAGLTNAAIDTAITKIYQQTLSDDQAKFLETPAFKKLYTEERDKVRAELARLNEENPGMFTGGQVAGAVAGSLIPAKLAAGAAGRIAKLINSSVGTGAVSAAGFSEADSASQLAGDIVKGAITGGVIGKLTRSKSDPIKPSNQVKPKAERSTEQLEKLFKPEQSIQAATKPERSIEAIDNLLKPPPSPVVPPVSSVPKPVTKLRKAVTKASELAFDVYAPGHRQAKELIKQYGPAVLDKLKQNTPDGQRLRELINKNQLDKAGILLINEQLTKKPTDEE